MTQRSSGHGNESGWSPLLIIGLICGALFGLVALVVVAAIAVFVLTRDSQTEWRQDEVAAGAVAGETTQTISLADGRLTLELPADFTNTIPVPFAGGLVTSDGQHYTYGDTVYGQTNADVYLRLGYETVQFSATEADNMQAFMLSSPVDQLLEDNDVAVQTVHSDTQGRWEGLPYRDIEIAGEHGLSSRYRSLFVNNSIVILHASWTTQYASQVEQYFDSLRMTANSNAAATVTSSEPSQTPVTAETLDLLPLIELPRDARQGHWVWLDDGIGSPPDVRGAILTLPCDVPDSYELTLTVERLGGVESFNVGLPVGDSMALVVMDGFGGTVSGLGVVSGQILPQRQDGYRGGLLDATPSEVAISVTPGSIQASCDGTRLIDWQGNSGDLTIRREFWDYQPDTLFIGSWESEFRISAATIREQ